MERSTANTTPRFSVSSADYVKVAARRRMWRYILLPALAILAAAAAGFTDPRWWYVGLILLFTVFPLVLSVTWMVMAAHPAMRWLLRPQRWTFTPDAVEVDFFRFPPAVSDLSDKSDRSDKSDPADALPVEHLRIPLKDMTEADSVSTYRVFDLAPRPLKIDFLLIPRDLVPQDFNID